MLAPGGGGLVLYQAYGNLNAMTGRKAYLLEDKQIPSVGVFDEVFCIWKAFGRNTRDLGSFRKETDKTTDLHQHLSRISTQKLETASQITCDAVTTHLKTASPDLQKVSEYDSHPRVSVEWLTTRRSEGGKESQNKGLAIQADQRKPIKEVLLNTVALLLKPFAG
ncbi:hypothetical protein Tco_1434648 [Tanacetum coccineum]